MRSCGTLPRAGTDACAASPQAASITGSGEPERRWTSSRTRLASTAAARADGGATVQQVTATLSDVPAGPRPRHGDWESVAQQSDGELSVQASVGTATPRRLTQTVNSDAHRRIKTAYSAIQITATYPYYRFAAAHAPLRSHCGCASNKKRMACRQYAGQRLAASDLGGEPRTESAHCSSSTCRYFNGLDSAVLWTHDVAERVIVERGEES